MVNSLYEISSLIEFSYTVQFSVGLERHGSSGLFKCLYVGSFFLLHLWMELGQLSGCDCRRSGLSAGKLVDPDIE